MDDVICLSSGSEEEDSDVEFVGSYSDKKEESVPFIRAELLAVTPVLIDITGHHFSPLIHRRTPRKEQSSTIEIIDLNLDCVSSDTSNSGKQLQSQTEHTDYQNAQSTVGNVRKSVGKVKRSSCTENFEKDVIYLDSDKGLGFQSPASSDQNKSSSDPYLSIQSCFKETNLWKSINHHEIHPCASDQLNQSEIEAIEHSSTLDIYDELLVPSETSHTDKLQNTKHTQPTCLSSADHSNNLNTEPNEKFDSPISWSDKAPSPFSLDSPYYCPSETDVFFSQESNLESNNVQLHSTDISNCTESLPCTTVETEHLQENVHNSPNSKTQSQLSSKTLPTSHRESPTHNLPCSPTSTEILASDSPDTPASSPDLTTESPLLLSPESPLSSSKETLLLDSKTSSECPPDQWTRFERDEMDTVTNFESSPSEANSETRQHISLVHLKKLKHFIGGIQDVDDRDEDDYGPSELLCRQSLSLVYSTIEENYPEGTLQLLSDLIQPRYYPPVDITSHLLRGILLEPHSNEVLALEAFNLLMKTQKYHPANISNVPWDWELLSSVMSEQDDPRGLQCEVRCLLFQYVLQVLEDDFHFKLPILRLHLSIAKAMLSCHQKFRQVKELMSWMLDAAKQSFCNSEDEEMMQRRKNNYIKMLLILQKMLLLAMEVDRTPTCSSSKLSQELCTSLNSTAPCRQLRLLLLTTLESNLLRCKLLELLLDQACSQKSPLPMSFKLLLHFLQTSTLAPDPSDGTERWKRWDELLQLLWMLMLSYEEVMTGHLRCSITERYTMNRAPMWTQNDQVTRTAVQEAAEAFLSRAVEDLGHALPSQIQESLSQLQEHLLSISLQ